MASTMPVQTDIGITVGAGTDVAIESAMWRRWGDLLKYDVEEFHFGAEMALSALKS